MAYFQILTYLQAWNGHKNVKIVKFEISFVISIKSLEAGENLSKIGWKMGHLEFFPPLFIVFDHYAGVKASTYTQFVMHNKAQVYLLLMVLYVNFSMSAYCKNQEKLENLIQIRKLQNDTRNESRIYLYLILML